MGPGERSFWGSPLRNGKHAVSSSLIDLQTGGGAVLPISGVSPDPGRTRGITMNKGSNLPLRKCPECGGSYFRQVKLHREPGTEMGEMPMWVLMCLCGAVQR